MYVGIDGTQRTVIIPRVVHGLVGILDVVERHLHVVIMVIVGMNDRNHRSENGG